MTENIGPTGLSIYCYTKNCVYESGWNDVTLLARGLVVDTKREVVVATPFPKFFNAFEKPQSIPDLPFEVFDKLDGSLIILFCWGTWQATTKGTFDTHQAKQASRLITDVSRLDKRLTYLLEYVGPENRIVIDYPEPKLYLLSAYDDDGYEIFYDELCMIAEHQGWEIARRQHFDSFADVLVRAKQLPATHEGHVARFENGLRLKIKGDEYCRIHSMISGVTPLGLWEMLRAGDDLGAMRGQIPEEFWAEFDQIERLLWERYMEKFDRIKQIAESLADLSDKELGLRLTEFPEDIRGFIFPYRRAGGDPNSHKIRETILKDIRPVSNYLAGYTPSHALESSEDH